jgi:hypothetical protein
MPVWPALSVNRTKFRVKNGAWAPLKVINMLSYPATGITFILVMVGLPVDIMNSSPLAVWLIFNCRFKHQREYKLE